MVASARDPSGDENQENPEGRRRRLQFSVGPTQAGYFFSAPAPFLQQLLFQKLRAVGSSAPRGPTGRRAAVEGRGEGEPRAGSAQLCGARRGDLTRWVEEGALAGRRPCPGAGAGARRAPGRPGYGAVPGQPLGGAPSVAFGWEPGCRLRAALRSAAFELRVEAREAGEGSGGVTEAVK
ncbi:unnamed protein product [Rangifer tarandus platyrhynchus]|uniref:Uncharacterized protein n=2 Tax=Rangifer tarandus platyrhynchus TaxID=3082113 RepID=A0ACB0FLB2_RANTA|nr:unnamed protein product [Rangifer tarandus platyrhynchus]CAI9713775.1 unnamed protein product [Rangifer tarandus platyrhynchus]